MSDMFSFSFDNQSLKEIAAFAGFGILLTDEVQTAETQIGNLIIQKTHDNALARFMTNSPGGLAESFVLIDDSPMEKEVGSPKKYSHRRDAGFDGADSLGRVYHDPPYNYFTDAVNEVRDGGEGMGILQDAVYRALARMEGA